MVYHSWKEWDTAIERRGLGLEMEAEFFGTDKGTRIFQLSIQQIQIAIMQSAATDVISTLLRAYPIPRNFYEAQRASMPYENLRRAFQPELEEWSILTKPGYGLLTLFANIKLRIRAVNGQTPNACILPEWFRDYTRTHCPALTKFSERGERGPSAFDSNSVLSAQLDGLRVIESPVLRQEDNRDMPEEPLEHNRVIGEHWYNHGKHLEHVDFKELKQYLAARTFTIHDNDTDSWHQVTLQDVAACLKKKLDQNAGSKDPAVVTNIEPKIERFIKAVEGKLPGVTEVKAADGTVTRRGMTAEEECIETLKETTVIILRPFEEWRMANAIFCVGEGRCIYTAMGYGDFRIGFDVARKKVMGHYTTYIGPVITDPESIYVAYNVAPVEYGGGGGSTFDVDLFFVITDTKTDVAVKRSHHCLPICYGGFPKSLVREDTDMPHSYADANEWADLYNFGNTEDVTNLLDVGYHHAQFQNSRTFLASGYGCSVNISGQITNPRGHLYIGNPHFGPYVYPGVRDDRLGRGANGMITKPDGWGV